MLWARGLSLQLASAKSAVVAPDNGLLSFGRQTWLGLTAWTWLMLLAFAVGAFALKYSAWARRVLAIGGNEESAQLLGVQTTGTKVSVYVLSGLAAGLAGIVLTSQTGSVSTDTGKGWELIAIAAVVIGGTLLSGGIGSVLGHLRRPVADAVDLQRHRVREWPGNHLDQLLLGVGHPWRLPADRGARTGPGRKETPAMTEQSQHALDRNDEHVAEATEGVAPMVAGVPVRLANLIARAEALADSGQRRILGITGAPGSGKGTVAQAVLKALGPSAVVVPMDGFHLAGAELDRLGRTDRKGAPETFDAAGYVALLRRLREPDGETVYAPEFHRDVEESYAGAIAVPSDVPLVITEGNYLLLDQGPWSKVRDLLDEAWFVAPYEDQRIARLVERHIRYGKTPEQAREWVRRSDELNAALVSPTRTRADIVILGDPT